MQENNKNELVEELFKKRSFTFNKNLFSYFLVSLFSVVLVLGVATGIAWENREKVFSYLTQEYLKTLPVNAPSGGLVANVTDADGTVLPVVVESKPDPLTQEQLVTNTVKKTNPAVVAILLTKEVPTYEMYVDPNQQNPFGDLFPGFFFNTPQYRQKGTEKKEVGGGSGFFVTSDGLIVTNRHVVDQEGVEYTVFTNNGKKYDAKVVARDQILDIALLKVSGSGFAYLSFGNSDNLEVGQTVIAIGNALAEFKNTVSVGVVSGLSRSITAGDSTGKTELLDNIIQTDAAINPGNSGGPLLDLTGRVIGVNVAVAQGSENIGFALPINSIKSVVESVKKTGKIVRPYLGVRYVSVNPEMKAKNGLSVDYGVLVKAGLNQNELAVIPGSPADKAGIVENDIILEINGRKLDDTTSLSSIIREKKIGDTVTLKVLSKGVQKTVYVTLEAAKD